MRTLIGATLIALVVAVVAAGCGGSSSGSGGTEPPATTSIPRATGANDVLVDVHSGIGAFTPVEYAIDDRPVFRLYGDGTVVVRGSDEEPLPQPITYRLSEEGIDAVLKAAEEAGLLETPIDYGLPNITDVGSTNVAVTAGGETYEHNAYALGFSDETLDGLTPEQRDARAKLQGFVDLATGLPEASPDLLVDQPAPLSLDALEVYAWPAPDDAQGTVADWPAATPLPGTPLADSPASGCLTLRGDDIAAVEDALAAADGRPLWRSDGKVWSVGYRAVLPGQTSCEDLAQPA